MPSAYPLPVIPNNPFFFLFPSFVLFGGEKRGGRSVIVSLVRVANIRDDGIVIIES